MLLSSFLRTGVHLCAIVLATVFVGAAGANAKSSSADKINVSVECAWIGKRIIVLLSREDVVSSDNFLRFYDAFGCSRPYLGKVFGCAIVDKADLGPKVIEGRTEACWTSPSTKFLTDDLDGKAAKGAVTGEKPSKNPDKKNGKGEAKPAKGKDTEKPEGATAKEKPPAK